MQIQWVLIGLFALNLLVLWLTVLSGRVKWYSPLASIIWLLIMLVMPVLDQPRFPDFLLWQMIGSVTALAGIAIVGIARYQLRKSEFNPVGLYKHIRHPLYLGLIFFFVGWCWVWAAIYSFYFGLAIIILLWLQAYLEEKFIFEKKFGEQYKEYRKTAGMFWIK